MVVVPDAVLRQYERFSLFNSPYPAHERGRAIDLYPGDGTAPSPVGGEVAAVRSVSAPSRSYAAERDHLIVVAVERPPALSGLLARLLHVEPAVAEGDGIRVGDDLGRLVRSGYFARWVDDHVHLGFREPETDPLRARGSLPVSVGAAVQPLDWDGTGTVVEAGETYAVLDAPAHPAPGQRWAGIGAGVPGGAVLDGGLAHYDGGGLLGAAGHEGPVSLLGRQVGEATGRMVDWDDVTVLADGEPVRGLSLFCARDAGFGAKLVGHGVDLPEGRSVTVEIIESGDHE